MTEPKTYVITGAGGQIGAATARRFAAPGVRLALFDRKADLVTELEEECKERGATVLSLGVDQTEEEQVRSAVDTVTESFDGIDVLFANAGYGRFAPLLEQPLDQWRRHIDVNMTGTFLVCQSVARSMVARQRPGSIVVNCSSGATQYTDLLGAYCSTKAALWMLVRGLASELGGHGIRVNAVLPGVIETGMTGPMLGGTEDHRSALLRATPAGRLGAPDDIAAAVAYLVSDGASFITGIAIPVDGGQTLHGQPQWYATDYRERSSGQWQVAK